MTAGDLSLSQEQVENTLIYELLKRDTDILPWLKVSAQPRWGAQVAER